MKPESVKQSPTQAGGAALSIIMARDTCLYPEKGQSQFLERQGSEIKHFFCDRRGALFWLTPS